MNINFLRILFILICSIAGYITTSVQDGYPRMQGLMIGLFLSLLILMIEFIIKKIKIQNLLLGIIGLISGLIIAELVFIPVFFLIPATVDRKIFFESIFLMFPYLGLVLMIKRKNELWKIAPQKTDIVERTTKKILDTSVIIDGRLLDICRAHFLEGVFIVPRFVLSELQGVADSEDALKRERGRRGLDILNELRNQNFNFQVINEDLSGEHNDFKLIQLAQKLHAKILTTDFNLNKLAALHKVEVLNLNDLANALKIPVIPGDEMHVKVIREGKEPNQGLAYLDDGTMIVIENGKQLINQKIQITITSVFQTSAGRLIFAKKI
jgi:uncharacterized protein YacL